MFTAALFTTAKTWTLPKRPPTEEWIKMWYTYTMEYFSLSEIMLFAKTWVDLVILSEAIHTKEKYDIPCR